MHPASTGRRNAVAKSTTMVYLMKGISGGLILTLFSAAIDPISAFPPLFSVKIGPSARKVSLVGPIDRHCLFSTNQIFSMTRRTKTQRVQGATSTDGVTEGIADCFQDQLAMTKLFRGVSMLHFGQVFMALKKSGLTLGSLNVIGGPLMAAGLMFLLGNASEKKCLSNDTFKRLNGLMVCYATMALCLVAIVPQLGNPFGMLYFISGSSTLFVVVKGYLVGLRVNKDQFFPDTLRLLKEAFQTSIVALPHDRTSLGYFVSLWTVATLKATLAWGALQLVLSPNFTIRQVAPILSQLTKLTILGGSLVTAMSMKDKPARDSTFVPLKMLASYVFGSMAGMYDFV